MLYNGFHTFHLPPMDDQDLSFQASQVDLTMDKTLNVRFGLFL